MGDTVTPMQACSGFWLLLCAVWFVSALRTKRTLQRLEFSFRLAYGVPVVVAFYLLFSDSVPGVWLNTRLLPRSPVLMSTGVALTGFGVALAIWARLYIGQNWSSAVSVKVEHQLVRTGPYAVVRHPIYSGILLATAGTALVRREPRGFIALLILIFGFTVKLRMEERLMRTTFGSEYDDYTKSTGALVPRLRRW